MYNGKLDNLPSLSAPVALTRLMDSSLAWLMKIDLL